MREKVNELVVAFNRFSKANTDFTAESLTSKEIEDLRVPLKNNTKVSLITTKSPEANEVIRHSAAHIMAEAIQHIWPEVKVTIGPVIENGFYYDFDSPFTFT